jgi:hypothetical protein
LYDVGITGGVLHQSDRDAVIAMGRQNRVRRGVHLHHVLPKREWPEYEIEELNLVLVCSPCHEHHEEPGVNDGRLFREALPDETRAWIAEIGDPMLLYYERTYR